MQLARFSQQFYRLTPYVLGSLMAACDREPLGIGASTEARSTPETSSAAAASARAPAASVRVSAASQAPKMKPYAHTEAAKLGTLPAGVGVPVGESAPQAAILDSHGRRVELSSLWRDRPLLLVFYRGGWCPFCNFQVRDFVKSRAQFEKLGVGLALVSVDRPDTADRTRMLHEIPFPVLSDSGLAAHEAFRVTHRLSEEEARRLASRGMDVEAASGKSHHTIAIPAMFLIDTRGTVRFAHADRDYKTRPDIDAVLREVEAALDGPTKP